MCVKLFYLSIIFNLLNCCTNCVGMNCWHKGDILQFKCKDNTDFSPNFLRCENDEVAHENVTNIIIYGCKVNTFPTEMFGIIHNVKELAMNFPQVALLSEENFVGANQLQKLSLSGGEFNISASIFVNAPKLKLLNIGDTESDGISKGGLPPEVGFIDPQAFSGASALRSLRLKIKMKTEFPQGLFDGLVNLEVLDLFRFDGWDGYNEVDIEALRFPAGNKIKLFKLGKGNIIQLKAEMFANLTNLTMLVLTWNNIQRIQPYTFVNLNQLILLQLEKNVIQQLTKTMLVGLTNLRAAIFSNNQIYYIESEAFSGMLHLRRLDLAENRLRAFEPHMFNGLLKLRHLDLSFNYYYNKEPLTVDLNMFCNLPNLSYLNLYLTDISKLKKCTQNGTIASTELTSPEIQFDTVTTAELLSEWNDLRPGRSWDYAYDFNIDVAYIDGTSHEKEFSPLLTLLDEPQNKSASGSSLTILHLERNELSDLDDNLFDAFVNLRILHLSSNPIKSLRSGQFNGLENLLILHLDHCELASLDFNVLLPLTNLFHLYVQGNWFHTITPPTRPMNRLKYMAINDNITDNEMLDKIFKNGLFVRHV